MTRREVADVFGVGLATVNRWVRQERERGDLAPLPRGGNRPRILSEEHRKQLDRLVKEHPDWTEDEFTKVFVETHGLAVSRSTIGREIRRLGYSVKKRPSSLRSEIVLMSEKGEESISKPSETSPLRVWYFWTKRART